MKWLHLAGAAVLFFALAVPGQAQDQKKKDGKKPAVEVVDAENALKPGKITGKILTYSENSLRLRVEFEHLELKDPKKLNRIQNSQLREAIYEQQQLARVQRDLLNARNAREQAHALQRLQNLNNHAQLYTLRQLNNANQDLFKVVKDVKDFDIDLGDSVAYRTKFLPVVYDEMGNRKKYTTEEIQELKGKTN